MIEFVLSTYGHSPRWFNDLFNDYDYSMTMMVQGQECHRPVAARTLAQSNVQCLV